MLGKTADVDDGVQLFQTWGSPWSANGICSRGGKSWASITVGCMFAFEVEVVVTEVSADTFD